MTDVAEPMAAPATEPATTEAAVVATASTVTALPRTVTPRASAPTVAEIIPVMAAPKGAERAPALIT